ncbi:ANTAR domain-containing protein [Blastococcus deserti]|uniref:ANTAR domain-containing protein n=1 Tax=Blastococcus deserti TaxID=2259033 RepID=A0ABW4X9N3_9ACTN
MTGSGDGPSTPGPRAARDELTRLVLAEENLQSVLERIVNLVTQVMPAGAEASITLMRDQQTTTAAFTGELALQLDEAQHGQGYGPCIDAALSGQFVEITDGRTEDRWPDYITTFLRSGALSSLAVPVPAVGLAACLNVYSPAVGAFTDEHRHAAAELAAYAAVVLTNVRTLQEARDQAENLRAAMASRAAIEQAKGILMERYKVTADEAFRLLTAVSMRTNRKVRDLAEHLVLTGELEL